MNLLLLGLELNVLDRSEVPGVVKRAFLKEKSFGKLFQLKHKFLPSDKQSIKIKLEIDVNPPSGSAYEIQYLDFPYPFPILLQDMPSLFADKCHSLLCRKYNKGRDWFDFSWYISKKTKINYKFSENALIQTGPFKNTNIKVNSNWIIETLKFKIKEINWETIKMDIDPF